MSLISNLSGRFAAPPEGLIPPENRSFGETKNAKNEIRENFDGENFRSQNFDAENFDGENFCEECLGENFWLPVGSSRWQCSACRPPPENASLVAAQRLGGRQEHLSDDLVSQPELAVIEAYGAPACPGCGGAWIVDQWRDQGSRMFCWSCRRETSLAEISESIAAAKLKPKSSRIRWGI